MISPGSENNLKEIIDKNSSLGEWNMGNSVISSLYINQKDLEEIEEIEETFSFKTNSKCETVWEGENSI